MSDVREFSTKRENSDGLPPSKRDEIHSLEVNGRRRLDGDAEDNEGDSTVPVGVRGRDKLAPESGNEGGRLEREDCCLRGRGDWPRAGRFIQSAALA